jgi:hypothetical protein
MFVGSELKQLSYHKSAINPRKIPNFSWIESPFSLVPPLFRPMRGIWSCGSFESSWQYSPGHAFGAWVAGGVTNNQRYNGISNGNQEWDTKY